LKKGQTTDLALGLACADVCGERTLELAEAKPRPHIVRIAAITLAKADF
jgi:hypothetical protein